MLPLLPVLGLVTVVVLASACKGKDKDTDDTDVGDTGGPLDNDDGNGNGNGNDADDTGTVSAGAFKCDVPSEYTLQECHDEADRTQATSIRMTLDGSVFNTLHATTDKPIFIKSDPNDSQVHTWAAENEGDAALLADGEVYVEIDNVVIDGLSNRNGLHVTNGAEVYIGNVNFNNTDWYSVLVEADSFFQDFANIAGQENEYLGMNDAAIILEAGATAIIDDAVFAYGFASDYAVIQADVGASLIQAGGLRFVDNNKGLMDISADGAEIDNVIAQFNTNDGPLFNLDLGVNPNGTLGHNSFGHVLSVDNMVTNANTVASFASDGALDIAHLGFDAIAGSLDSILTVGSGGGLITIYNSNFSNNPQLALGPIVAGGAVVGFSNSYNNGGDDIPGMSNYDPQFVGESRMLGPNSPLIDAALPDASNLDPDGSVADVGPYASSEKMAEMWASHEAWQNTP